MLTRSQSSHGSRNNAASSSSSSDEGGRATVPAIPKYSGKPQDMLLDMFRFAVDTHFTMLKEYGSKDPSEAHKVLIVASRFRKRAKTWWQTLVLAQQIPRSLDALFREMKDYFESDLTRIEEVRERYAKLKMYSSVKGYNDSFRQVMVQLPSGSHSASQILHDYIRGLTPELSLKVKEANPTTLEQAMKSALEREKFAKPTASDRSENKRSSNGHSSGKKPQQKQSNNGFNNRKKIDPKNITCFICEKKGHFAQDCFSNPNRRPSGSNNDKQQRWEAKKSQYLKSIGINAIDAERQGNE